jgi:hypothetical protein
MKRSPVRVGIHPAASPQVIVSPKEELVRKLSIVAAVAIVASLAFAAAAYAVNVYKVTPVGTSGAGKGTSAKPAAKKVKFGFTAIDSSGVAATPIKKYSIQFQGLKSYAKNFPKCTFSQANGSTHATVCKKAKVGSGTINNKFGRPGQPNPSACKVNLVLYNTGSGLALRLDGSPTTTGCPITVAQAINAKFSSKSVGGVKGTALTFDTPTNVLHPIPGLDNSVANVSSTISSKTTKVKIKGKTRKVSILSSTACGKGGKRTIQVQFTDEKNSTVGAKSSTKC